MEVNKIYLFLAILSTFSFIHVLIVTLFNASKRTYYKDISWFRWFLIILSSLFWTLAF